MNILYLCDRRACETCNILCNHTEDATHAKSFETVSGNLMEKDMRRYMPIIEPLSTLPLIGLPPQKGILDEIKNYLNSKFGVPAKILKKENE